MHVDSKHPTVLVSPSMDTGVSLDDDLARFQVITKYHIHHSHLRKIK
jgi:hypothetical protein